MILSLHGEKGSKYMSSAASWFKNKSPVDAPRHCRQQNHPEVLTDIYREDTNIVIWQRSLSNTLIEEAQQVIKVNPNLQTSAIVTPDNAESILNKTLGESGINEDIIQLVDMFCCLFDASRAGLRLSVLNKAMCPRFHVDRVPCRLVTTYSGVATQWLQDAAVERSYLAKDEQVGLFQQGADIQSLNQGDVALLKGELWEGNEGHGLIHRSPQLSNNTQRLLLTLDLVDG